MFGAGRAGCPARTQPHENPAMNLSLSKVKINKRLSEETTCFSATVLVDGVPAGEAGNRGHGGSNFYHWKDGEVGRAVKAWAEAQDLKFEDGTRVIEKLDFVVGRLVAQDEVRKKFLRDFKTKTLWRLKGDATGSWLTTKSPLTPAVKKYILDKYGDRVECIANEDVETAIAFC